MKGLYRFVRNPMYTAVVAIILGQALLFGDWGLLMYGALVALAFNIFVQVYEEPTLVARYGTQYAGFRRNVPRCAKRHTVALYLSSCIRCFEARRFASRSSA